MAQAAAAKKKKPKTRTVESSAVDKLREIQDKHLDSIPNKVKSGELDPTAFTIEDEDLLRPIKAETLRINAIIEPLLDEHYGRGGKYKWNVSY